MEIRSIHQLYQMQAGAVPANFKKTAEDSGAQVADSRGTDTVDISSDASFKVQLSKKAKAYAAENNDKVTDERIAELKRSYQGDACPISGSEIAAKIIAGIVGPDGKD